MKIPFSPPFIDNEVVKEVVDTLNSGWITSGPRVKALEEEIVKFTNAPAALCVNSWSSGALLILKWWGIGPGDEVIVPAYTYSATALVVLQCGAIPIMVDSGDDFNITVETIKNSITPKTKAIIPVDIAGWPCDYNGILELVNSDSVKQLFKPQNEQQKKLGRIIVISDAAHSIGAKSNGVQSGCLSDITIFSFHAVKNITTAEGGCVCLCLPFPFDNYEVHSFLKIFSLNGQTKDAFTKSQAGGWRYDIIAPGLKVNMPDICAAIGLIQLKKYENELLLERRRVFETYSSYFSKYNWAQLPMSEMNGRVTSFHLYPLRILNINEAERDKIIDLITKLGVSVNVHFTPMPMFTLFKSLGYKIDDYPIAYNNYSREISLPIYPQLNEEQIQYIVEAVVLSYQNIIG
jgi:dTDP-4-amino-4,6-dideoxygalactose transaminase